MPEKIGEQLKIYVFTSREQFTATRAMLSVKYAEVFKYPTHDLATKIAVFTQSYSPMKNKERLIQAIEKYQGLPFLCVILDETEELDFTENYLELFEEKLRMLLSPTPSNPPKYPAIQVALDLLNQEQALKIVEQLPQTENLLVEAGTPLIKSEGMLSVRSLKQAFPFHFLVADLKTLDTGALEVDLAVNAGADAISISGLGNEATINAAVKQAHKHNRLLILDMLNVQDPLKKLESLDELPDITLLHRGIDMETHQPTHQFELLQEIKARFPAMKVAIAGGITLNDVEPAIANGADIIIVGRAITQSSNIKQAVNEFLSKLVR